MSSQIPPGVDLCSIPAGPPPPGVVPNFVNPVDLSVETFAAGGILTSLSLLFLTGRLYANWNRLKLADYLTVVGFCFSAGYSGIILGMHKYTRHAWDMPACWYMADYIWKLLFAQNFILGPTQFLVKVAILALYFQVFAVARKMRYVIWAGIIFSAILYFPHPILVAIFNAPRIGQPWAILATNGMPQKLAFYAPIHGIGAIILDSYILIIPMLVLGKLQVAKKKKLQLVGVFLTALLGVISSCFSCYWRIKITFSSGDYTWEESQLFIWIMVEHDVALIVGCMPALAAFLKTQSAKSTLISTMRSKLFSSNNSSNASSKPGSSAPKPGWVGEQSSGRRARSYYYELDDTLLNTRTTEVTAVPIYKEHKEQILETSEDERGILKVTNVSQETSPYHAV